MKFNVKTLTKIGVLSAIATVLMLFQLPLWFVPGFYKLDLSEVAVLIGGFALGPVPGIFIELIKILINFAIDGTTTGGVGELSNFLIGCSFVVPASIIYKHKKSQKSAILGLVVGGLMMTVIGCLLNYFIMLPLYAKIMLPLDAIISAGNLLNKYIVDLKSFVLFATAPFNLVKAIIVALPTILLYKRLSKILHK